MGVICVIFIYLILTLCYTLSIDTITNFFFFNVLQIWREFKLTLLGVTLLAGVILEGTFYLGVLLGGIFCIAKVCVLRNMGFSHPVLFFHTIKVSCVV